MPKNILPRNKLNLFKEWLTDKNINFSEGNVAVLIVKLKYNFYPLHENSDKDYQVEKQLEPILYQFLKETKHVQLRV
jgi:hypothetical protein